MKVLLDECVPKRLANEFHNHDVSTVTKEGWSGTKNGDLLKLATRRFDVFVTVDQNLEYQQNLEESGISVVVLEVESNHLDILRPLVAKVEKSLTTLKPRRNCEDWKLTNCRIRNISRGGWLGSRFYEPPGIATSGGSLRSTPATRNRF